MDFKELLKISVEHELFLEGQIIQLIDRSSLSEQELKYLDESWEKFVTKQRRYASIQASADKLEKSSDALQASLLQIKEEKEKAEEAKFEAERLRLIAEDAKNVVMKDLEVMQLQTQNRLIESSVKFNYILLSAVMGAFVVIYIVLILRKHGDSSIIGNGFATLSTLICGSAMSLISFALGKKENEAKK